MAKSNRRGKSEISRTGSPDIGVKTERLSDLPVPADTLHFGYKSGMREPRAVSDSVATAPVSMAPKRQVRARGEAPSASQDEICTPRSEAPSMYHDVTDRAGPNASPHRGGHKVDSEVT
jgi:hypothetical protein